MAPLLHRVSSTGIPATLMTFNSSIQAWLLFPGGTTTLQQRLFLYIKPEPSLWLAPATSHGGWRLEQSKWWLLVSLCQGPGDTTIKASLSEDSMTHVKKGKLWSPHFTLPWCKKICYNTCCISNPFRHSIVKNVMYLSISCTSGAAISPPSEPCRTVIVLTAALVWEISYSVSEVPQATGQITVWNQKDSDQSSYWHNLRVMISRGKEAQI